MIQLQHKLNLFLRTEQYKTTLKYSCCITHAVGRTKINKNSCNAERMMEAIARNVFFLRN